MIDKDLLKNLTVEQKQVLLDQLMNSLSETKQKEEAVSSKPQSTVTEDFRVTSSKTELERGRVPVKARKNQWVDDGQFQLEGEDECLTTEKELAGVEVRQPRLK